MTSTDNYGLKFPKKQRLRNNEYYNTQEMFDELYQQSKQNKNFTNLYEKIISIENINLAYRNIKKNTGGKTSGVDGKTIKHLQKYDSNQLVSRVRNRLINYKPQAVRRVMIPKDIGGTEYRPLGIPTIGDRLIQQCIKQILEPICEAKFHNHSYGFRPNRGTHHAIARAYSLAQRNNLHYVVDIDIKGFFDNVNHGKLIKQMWTMGIRDKRVLSIISKILKSEIEGEGIPTKGTPQGGIISPLLSNIVLNELDWWVSSQWETIKTRNKFSEGKINKATGRKVTNNTSRYLSLKRTKLKEVFIVRYADDFKLFCRDSRTAFIMYNATRQWLKERLDLEISPNKSKVVNLRKNYSTFLGIKMKVVPKGKKLVVKSHVSEKGIKKIKEKLKINYYNIGKFHDQGSVNQLNATIVGLQNYYQVATHVNKDFGDIRFSLKRRYYNRTRRARSKGGIISQLYKKRYKGWKGKPVFVAGLIIFPLDCIQTKPPINFSQSVNNYTEEGRKEIHFRLRKVSDKDIKYVMENPIPHRSIEFNDNRISLFVGQNGRCRITEQFLDVSDMATHHVKPTSTGGTDKYNNLILIKSEVHRLIHATRKETIEKYLKLLNLTEKQLSQLNYYRSKVGNYTINNI